jgi:hypothetical protein
MNGQHYNSEHKAWPIAPIWMTFLAVTTALYLSIISFGGYYIVSPRESLVLFFYKLNDCFYGSANWPTTFFNADTKRAGNTWCLLAIIIATIIYYMVVGHGKRWFALLINGLKWPKAPPWTLIVSLSAACIAWFWGQSMAKPAFDEVFSAQEAASLHPLQTAGYYMLPNNHILFNLLNNVIGFGDRVWSGRLLSLISYLGVVAATHAFTGQIIKGSVPVLFVTIVTILQFFCWAFSFQARGYELYLLLEVVLVLAAWQYLTKPSPIVECLLVLSTVFGYLCIPSFLYVHIAILLFIGFAKICDFRAWKRIIALQCMASGLIFLTYLPALCFSGLDSIAHNHYVAPMGRYKTYGDFTAWMFPYFNNYIEHIFSSPKVYGNPVGIGLICLPILLLVGIGGRAQQKLVVFLMLLWMTFFAITIYMKRLPFERNLIGHYFFTVWVAAITIATLVTKLPRHWRNAAFTSFGLGFCAFYFYANQEMLKDVPYEHDVNANYTDISRKLKGALPTPMHVAVSDEAYFCGYLLRQDGWQLSRCLSGNEDYYIKKEEEKLPEVVAQHYHLVAHANEYEIFARADHN